MRILIINHEFPNFSEVNASTCTHLLEEFSKRSDLEIEYVTISEDYRYHQLRMGERVTIHRLPVSKKPLNSKLSKGQLLTFAWRARKFSLELSRKNHFDLVHAFSIFPDAVAASMLLWHKKIAYCLSIAYSDLATFNSGIVLKLKKNALKKAYFATCEKLPVKKTAENFFGQKIIDIIPRGIDVENFYPDLEKREDGYITLLSETELIPANGARYLIQALKIIVSRYPHVKLTLIGSGSEKVSLMDLARGLEIKNKVEFFENPTEKQRLQLYQSANIFVLPALETIFSNEDHVRKALAAGLAVVATKTLQSHELVLENLNGLWVNIETADDLAEKIEKLILDANLRFLMNKNSRDLAVKLSWENIARQYLAIYEKIRNLEKIKN